MDPLQEYLNGPQFKWAPNNNIVSGGPSPFNLMFANQFKQINRVKLSVSTLKVADALI